jgi:hypothetical protein
MTIPRWSTIGLLVALVVQFVFMWLQAKKTGEGFRGVVLPSALMAGVGSIAFAREFFIELPDWIDATLLIVCWLLILMAFGLWLVHVKRYLKRVWRLEEEKDK